MLVQIKETCTMKTKRGNEFNELSRKKKWSNINIRTNQRFDKWIEDS